MHRLDRGRILLPLRGFRSLVILPMALGPLSGPIPAGWAGEGLAAGNAPVEMTLADAVFIALRNNLSIRSAYMDRVAQKSDLLVSEDIFMPDLNLEGGLRRNASLSKTFDPYGTNSTRNVVTSGTLQPTITGKIPTGADFSFTSIPSPRWIRHWERRSTPGR